MITVKDHQYKKLSLIICDKGVLGFWGYVSSGEINSTVKDAAAATSEIESIYGAKEGVSVDHLDGLTIEGDTWWFNLRASNTEPLLRLNVEAVTRKQMEAVRDDVLNTIRR
jgi:phosphomannomutase